VNVKLCGLQTEADVDAAIEAEATHGGFIVQAPESHRNLDLGEAADLVDQASEELTTVIVTPSDEPDRAREAIEKTSADVLQASGDIAPETLAEIGEDTDADAWKAVGLTDEAHETIAEVDRYAEAGTDAVVLDALEAGYGGHGEQIDWGHANHVRRSIAIDTVLAGGLTIDNVTEAVQTVDPWCVDVSSGIETDEANDPDKMQAFVQAAREARS
jgi:phosphoribosylanthranilate isomerase